MNRIDSLKDLNALVNEIRLLRKGYISNLFINPLKNSLWIKKKGVVLYFFYRRLFRNTQKPIGQLSFLYHY